MTSTRSGGAMRQLPAVIRTPCRPRRRLTRKSMHKCIRDQFGATQADRRAECGKSGWSHRLVAASPALGDQAGYDVSCLH